MNNTVTLDKVTIEINASAGSATANIDKLASTLNALRSAAKGGFSNLGLLAKNLSELKSASSGIGKISEDLSSLDRVSQSLQSLSNISNPKGLSKTIESLEKLPTVFNNFNTNSLSNMARVSNDLSSALTPLAEKLSSIAQGYSAINALADKYGVSVTKIASKNQQSSKDAKILSNALSGMGSMLKGLTKQSQSLIKSFTSGASKINSKIKQIGLSLLGTRTIFTATRKAVSEYMAMDAELTWKVGNNWRALGAQLAPAIEYVTYLFKQFVRVVYSVILALTGIDLIARANEKAMKGWGKSAKDTLGNLQKFDDLNVVEFPKGSGGDDDKLIDLDTIDLTPIQKVIDWVRKLKEEIKEAWDTGQWYGVGKVFAEGVNAALGAINSEAILSKVDSIVSDVADGINGLFENLEGANIGKAIDFGLSFIPTSINMFLEKVNWDIIGVRITEALDNINPDKILNEIFGVIGNSFDAVQRIFLNIDSDTLAESLTSAITGFANGITRVITTIKWSEIGKKLHDVLVKMDWKEIWEAIFNGLKSALAGLGSLVAGTLFGAEFETEAGAIFAGIGTLLGIKLVSGIIKFLSSNLTGIGSLISGKLTSSIGGLFGKSKTIFGEGGASGTGLSVPKPKDVLVALGDLAIIIGGLTALITAIGALMKISFLKEALKEGIDAVVKVFKGIGDILLPLVVVSALMIGMGIFGGLGVGIIAIGLGDLAIIIGGLTGVVAAIGTLTKGKGTKETINGGIDMIKNLFNGISEILGPLAIMTGLIVAAGLVTPIVIVSGLIGLGLVMRGFLDLMAILGVLKQNDGFMWLVHEGGDLLIIMAEYLGSFAGTLVGSFVASALDGIVGIGEKLSEFMEKAKPFFDGLTSVDASATEAAKNMAEVMLILTANNIIDNLTSWITGGSNDQLLKFGKMLPEFGTYMKQYGDNIAGIDADLVIKTSDAVKSIVEFAKIIPNSDGLWNEIAGDNKLSDFGAMLAEFGPHFASYYDSIKGVNADIVKTTSDAVTSVIEFAKIIPNSDGLWNEIAGDNKLSDFGLELSIFAIYFDKYYQQIKDIDADVVKSTSDAVSSVMEFGRIVPQSTSLWSLITGSSNLVSFGVQLADFGVAFKRYYDNISKISASAINTVTDAISKLVDQYKIIKDNKLDKTVGDFGRALSNSSSDITSFFSNTFSSSKAWNIGYSFGTSLASAIVSGIRNTRFPSISLRSNDTGQTMQTFKISAYAGGGFVDSGQFFFANENGVPEYVGSIGNRAAVANNQQIIAGIKQGVKEAMMETESSQNLTVKLGNDVLYKAQQRYNRRQNDIYGTDVII